MPLPGNIVGVDPGKMSGLAIFSPTGQPLVLTQLDIDQMIEFTTVYKDPVAVVVVEDFVTFRQRAKEQVGSRQHASQVIGMMKVFAKQKGARFVLQPAARKEEGSKLSGHVPPSDHSQSHQVDAFNHAFFWMHRAGIVKSVLERKVLG